MSTCSACHKLGALGKSEVGPPLDGMGTHDRAELLTQILDPNREVDPAFWQVNVTTRRGESVAGVIASENAVSLTLRNPSGEVEIRKADIVTREVTRRSLMPEGFEALGAEALRDILTFLAGAATGRGDTAGRGARPERRRDAAMRRCPQTTPIVWAPGRTKVLIIGGGSSHNFGVSFGTTDRATLEAAGFSVNYTEDRDQAAAEIGNADVAVISVNRQFFDTPAYRKALFDFVFGRPGWPTRPEPGTRYGAHRQGLMSARPRGRRRRPPHHRFRWNAAATPAPATTASSAPSPWRTTHWMTWSPRHRRHTARLDVWLNTIAKEVLNSSSSRWRGMNLIIDRGGIVGHHHRARRTRARPRRVQDAPDECGPVGRARAVSVVG